MRTLHVGLRVSDRERSVAFYTAVGYEIVGSVPGTPIGDLTMLKLPGDEFVTIELVHNAAEGVGELPSGLSHLVVKVESMEATLDHLAEVGIDAPAASSPDGSADFLTSWVVDPDGNKIELVQWPPGHADGMTVADMP